MRFQFLGFHPAVILCSTIILSIYSSAADASDITAADEAAFKEIISAQISAFQTGNAEKAYAFASPGIQQKFADPGMFMSMARNGYAPVYDPRSIKFNKTGRELGGPTQHLDVVGPAGKLWTAIYGFEKQPDGTWRISSVRLVRRPGAGT